jgi:hypothetical protein
MAFIAALDIVPDRAPAGPDRRHRSRQSADRRRMSPHATTVRYRRKSRSGLISLKILWTQQT